MMFKEAEYAAIRANLRIDPQRLGDELVEHPDTLLKVLECVIQSSTHLEAATQDHRIQLAIVAAELREQLRNGRKPTEDAIKAEAPLDDRVVEAARDMSDARADHSYWQALAEAMRAKLSAMKRISDLTVSGYMTTGTAYAPDARAALAQARREKPVIERKRVA